MSPYANRTRPEAMATTKRLLRAGERIRFSVVEDDGSKRRSHEIVMDGRRFVLTGMDGEDLGAFATLGAATRAGFAASAEALEHGQK